MKRLMNLKTLSSRISKMLTEKIAGSSGEGIISYPDLYGYYRYDDGKKKDTDIKKDKEPDPYDIDVYTAEDEIFDPALAPGATASYTQQKYRSPVSGVTPIVIDPAIASMSYSDVVSPAGASFGSSAKKVAKIGKQEINRRHNMYIDAVVRGLGIPSSNYQQAMRFFKAMLVLEATNAYNNPFATTLGGSSYSYKRKKKFNDVGVKNYLTFEDGVHAVIDTLSNPSKNRYAKRYAGIIEAMRSPGFDAAYALTTLPVKKGLNTWGGTTKPGKASYADRITRILSRGDVMAIPPKRGRIDLPTGGG